MNPAHYKKFIRKFFFIFFIIQTSCKNQTNLKILSHMKGNWRERNKWIKNQSSHLKWIYTQYACFCDIRWVKSQVSLTKINKFEKCFLRNNIFFYKIKFMIFSLLKSSLNTSIDVCSDSFLCVLFRLEIFLRGVRFMFNFRDKIN